MKKNNLLEKIVFVVFWILILAFFKVITINPIEEWGPKFERVETFGPVEQQDSIQLTPIFK